VGLRGEVAVEDIGRPETCPQLGECFGRRRKVVTTSRQGRAIHSSGGSAADQREWITAFIYARNLANTFQYPRLIGASRATAGDYEPDRASHSFLPGSIPLVLALNLKIQQ
jgi:hypothetical protein